MESLQTGFYRGHSITDRSDTIQGINDIYNRIRDDCKYTIKITKDCHDYDGGYTSEGYIGCITIENQDIQDVTQ